MQDIAAGIAHLFEADNQKKEEEKISHFYGIFLLLQPTSFIVLYTPFSPFYLLHFIQLDYFPFALQTFTFYREKNIK